MMTLKEQLAADLQDAMRARDETRRTTLRSALAAIRVAEDTVALARMAAEKSDGSAAGASEGAEEGARIQVQLSDDEVRQTLARQIKQRRDSIEQFSTANRPELATIEAAEIAVLQAYLPQALSREQIEAAARDVIAEVGAHGPADKAKVMPVLIKRLAGQAEGREINAVVTALLG